MNNMKFDKLLYQYHDASVPPEYHRSYDITINNTEIKKLVHSYGDTINEDISKIKVIDFKKLIKLFSDCKIRNCDLGEIDSCAGGTGISILCYRGETKVFGGHLYFCGGEKYGNLCGDTEKLLSCLNKLLIK